MEINEGIKWIIGTVITILGLVGVGKLFELRAARRYVTTDRNTDIANANTAKQIDSETAFRELLVNRVEKLEADIKEMQQNHLTQAVENAELKAENKSLHKDNERLDKENEKSKKQIVNLENELGRTREDLQKLREEFEAINKSNNRNALDKNK